MYIYTHSHIYTHTHTYIFLWGERLGGGKVREKERGEVTKCLEDDAKLYT